MHNQKKLCTRKKKIALQKIFVMQKLCTCRICKSCICKNILRCRFAHFVHDGFSHICRFAHLCSAHLSEVCEHVKTFLHKLSICKLFVCMLFHDENIFFHVRACFLQIWRKSTKSRKSWKSRKCPILSRRFLTCSRKCPKKAHVFLSGTSSGSWANAFDNTGWQKSPEYALIRIAAGAPDLAKSPNPPPGRPRAPPEKSPLFPPDGKAPGFGARARFCSPGWNPFRSCFSWSAHNSSESSNGFRGASSSATESDTFCKCAHTSQNTRWKPPSGPTTFCTPCTPCTTETEPCTLVHNRATAPDTSGREHIVHVLLLLGRWGGAERPRAIDSIQSYYLLYICLNSIVLILILHYATRGTLNAKSNISGGIRMRRSHKDPEWGTLWDSTKCLRLCADVFPQTEKGRKKEPKRPPLFYIYIACKGLFLDGFRDGRGTVKVDSPKRRGGLGGKTVWRNYFKICACVNYFFMKTFYK